MVVALSLAGCGRIGFDPPGGTADAPQVPPEAGPTTYNDVTDPAHWAAFDLTTVNPGANGFEGAVFDGRYAYFVPSYNGTLDGIVARCDTRADFTTAAAWTTFDTATVNPNAVGFNGGGFDGRYLYLVPQQNPGGIDGIVARYDTQAPFGATTSWTTFDVRSVNSNGVGFIGATFDGRYLYLIPYQASTVARYDTLAPFTAPGSWAVFDLAPVYPAFEAFVGAVFDGRYVYLPPFFNGAVPTGAMIRYDTQASFTATGSWSVFDTTTLPANAKGFAGAGFDGQFVYLAPFISAPGMFDGLVARYDSHASFTDPASWQTFDTLTLDPGAKGFFGTAFDGRYTYLAPYNTGVVTRYDTQASFVTASSWSTFDATSVSPAAQGFYGAVFDGQYVYFVPHSGGTMARFDAKSPPSMPALPAFHGSFF